AMRRLADEDLAVTLALSLHAPDDELRDELVPVNQRWKVAEVLDAAWGYADRTGRRVSIEYAMIRDVNDQPWRADLLGRLLAGRLAHVNLIPLNPTPGSRWDASAKPVEREFVRRLRAAGVPTTVRDTRGREVHGVVFRVRFGGYDEWQVDLHLDRVERQLGELEERGGFVPTRGPERIGPGPMREERMLPPVRDDRMAPPPMRDDRPMAPPPP